MWDDLDLVVLGVAVVVIPIVVVFGLFRLAALKRAEKFPPVSEWEAQEFRTPK